MDKLIIYSDNNLGVAADRSGPHYPFQVLVADRSDSGLSTTIANAASHVP
jgi:hypothetical protein